MHVDNISEQVKRIYFSVTDNYSRLKISNKSNTKPERSVGATLIFYWRHLDLCQHNYNSDVFLHNDRLLSYCRSLLKRDKIGVNLLVIFLLVFSSTKWLHMSKDRRRDVT